MGSLVWIFVFGASLALLVKSADWLLESGEKVGLKLGFSPFVVGVLIVGLGTSLPELISGLAAIMQGATEIVVANAVGSNIANILLVIGVAAVVAKRLAVTKNLIDSELPLLAVSTVIFLVVVYNGEVTRGESFFLISAYLIYLYYTIYGGEGDESRSRFLQLGKNVSVTWRDYTKLAGGVLGLFIGAKYLIDAVIQLSAILNIAPDIISITAIAVGTSLPEVMVSYKAAVEGKAEVAVGNILGSNAFNALMVVGIPTLFTTLKIETATLYIGVPTMALATLLFIISGISKTIYRWEGLMFLLLYGLFTMKLFSLL